MEYKTPIWSYKIRPVKCKDLTLNIMYKYESGSGIITKKSGNIYRYIHKVWKEILSVKIYIKLKFTYIQSLELLNHRQIELI